MFKFTCAIARKDVTLTIRGAGIIQPLLLGLLLVFMFSLSQKAGTEISPQTAGTIFWLASSFCVVLIFNTLFAHEEVNDAKTGLLLAAAPITGVFLGKALAGLLFLLLAQSCLLPAALVFLGQNLSDENIYCLCGIFLVDIGLASIGALLGALAQGQSGRESLLSLLVFPLLVPLLLAGISIVSSLFGDITSTDQWIGFALAFDAVFTGLGLLLFKFVYTGED